VKPLNGEKTHPLSQIALDALVAIEKKPAPRQTLNPGLVNRLLREALVESVYLPSPWKSVKRSVEHLQITAAGRERLVEKSLSKKVVQEGALIAMANKAQVHDHEKFLADKNWQQLFQFAHGPVDPARKEGSLNLRFTMEDVGAILGLAEMRDYVDLGKKTWVGVFTLRDLFLGSTGVYGFLVVRGGHGSEGWGFNAWGMCEIATSLEDVVNRCLYVGERRLVGLAGDAGEDAPGS